MSDYLVLDYWEKHASGLTCESESHTQKRPNQGLSTASVLQQASS